MSEKKTFRKRSRTDYGIAFEYAFEAAARATQEYLDKYPNAWYPCGFAWVEFDGRDPAVKFLKEAYANDRERRGDKGYPKGWHIWNPSRNATQCMDAKVEGARAFVKMLAKYGIEAKFDSRWD